jgi:hypothetical protein
MEQAEELSRSGMSIFSYSPEFRKRLQKGLIAFCIFIGNELAHISWIALNEKTKNIMHSYPYKVDFADSQAAIGGVITYPKYRHKNLMSYGYFKRQEYLKHMGIKTTINISNVNAIAPQKIHIKYGASKVSRAKYIRLLYWQYWKEIPDIEQ